MSLQQRFEKFIATQAGYESIDALLRDADPHGMDRADYMLQGRSVIIEQKVLAEDPAPTAQRFAERIAKERGIHFWGKVSTKQLFAQQPDVRKLKFQLYGKVTERCRKDVAKAHEQIRDSRKHFNIPEALGLLVLLNESAPNLDIELMANRVARSLKREVDGALEYPSVDAVMLLSEHHSLGRAMGLELLPVVLITGPSLSNRRAALNQFWMGLQRNWAAFNGVALVQADLPPHDWPLQRRTDGH